MQFKVKKKTPSRWPRVKIFLLKRYATICHLVCIFFVILNKILHESKLGPQMNGNPQVKFVYKEMRIR